MQGETVFASEFSMGYLIPGWSGVQHSLRDTLFTRE